MSKFLGEVTPEQLASKTTAQVQIQNWEPQHGYLVCLDIDGHLLDNMTAKQVLVFHPTFMEEFGLWGIESYFREHAEFHNLWSTTRGCDRHEAMSYTLGSLLDFEGLELDIDMRRRMEVVKGVLDSYIGRINKSDTESFGRDSLRAFRHKGGEELVKLYGWSTAVDNQFQYVTIPMEPFVGVRETLEFVADKADVLIVSKTPYDDILNWLTRHDLIDYVTAIAGKEMGGKDESICVAKGGTYEAGEIKEHGTRYADDNVIMGGDGKGDWKAANKNNAFFFGTPPGKEELAWQNAIRNVFDPFFKGTYGERQSAFIEVFNAAMLTEMPWKQPGYDHRESYKGVGDEMQNKRQMLYHALNPGGRLLVMK